MRGAGASVLAVMYTMGPDGKRETTILSRLVFSKSRQSLMSLPLMSPPSYAFAL
jgi:hypothetical protein